MNFKIAQKELAAILAAPAKLPKTNGTIAIAECLRIFFSESGVSVSGTDFEVWLTRETDGFKKPDAVAIVPARAFSSLVASLPSDAEITFTVTAKKMTMKTKGSTYNFGSLPADEWPDMKISEMKKSTIPAKQFRDAIKFAIESVSTDDARYYLTGIHVMECPTGLRFAASNGHKMSWWVIEKAKKIGLPERGIILTHKTCRTLLDLISDCEEDIEFSASQTNCSFRIDGSGNFHLKAKLIDGEFPDVSRVVPFDRDQVKFTVPRVEVIAAINRLGIIADAKSRAVNLDFDGNGLTLRVKSEADDAEEKIVVAGEEKISSCVNAQYFAALLGSCSAVEVDILVDKKDPYQCPMIVAGKTPISKESQSFAVIMPMRG